MLHPLPSSEGTITKLLMVFTLDNPGQPCNFEVHKQVETYIRRVVAAFGPGVEYLIFASCRSAVDTGEMIAEKFNELVLEINKDTVAEFHVVSSKIFYKNLPCAATIDIQDNSMKLKTTVQDFIHVFSEPHQNIVLQKPIYTNAPPRPGSTELIDGCINEELAFDNPEIKMRPSRINIEGGQTFFGKTGKSCHTKYFMIVDERALEPEKQMYPVREELLEIVKKDFCVDIVIPVSAGEIIKAKGFEAFYHLDIYFLLAGKKGNQQLVYVADLDTQFLAVPEVYEPLKKALDEVAIFFAAYNEDGLSFAVRRLKTPLLSAYSQYFTPSYLNSFVENLPGGNRKIYIPDYEDEENEMSAVSIAYAQSAHLWADKSLGLESFLLPVDEDESRWKFKQKLPEYQREIITALKNEFSDVIPVKGKYFKHVTDAFGSLHCRMKPLARDADG